MEEKEPKNYAIGRGWGLIPNKETTQFKKDFMSLFGFKSTVPFYNMVNGRRIPTMEEADKIEKLFEKYGVPKSKIWGK